MAADAASGAPGKSAHGNVALLEHLNLNTDVPEAALAFFVDGLGCAQDSRVGEALDGKVYINGIAWFNAGLSQFHVPITSRGASGAPNNVFRGKIGLQVPSLQEFRQRLRALEASERFAAAGETRFAWGDSHGGVAVEVTGPFGNTWVVTEAPESARDVRGYHPGSVSWCLGVPYVEFACPRGAAPGIARYYSHYMGALAEADAGVAVVRTSPQQSLRFVEDSEHHGVGADAVEEPYHEAERGMHICIYVYDHAGPMERLRADGLLWGNPRFRSLDRFQGLTQFRCKDLVDPLDSSRPRKVLLELEQEVRTLTHATSPFGHKRPYLLKSREETVPAMVYTVTDAFEKDFAALRAQASAAREGWVPPPAGAAPAAAL